MFVKPATGLIVRDPGSMVPLPVAGREVPDITYWHQRLRDGDVVLAAPPAADVQPVTEA